MKTTSLTTTQAEAERRAIELFLNVSRATRVTSARDLDFTEALIRRERALQAELAAIEKSFPASMPAAA